MLTAWVVAPAGCRRVTFFVGPDSVVVSRCDDGGLYADGHDMLSVWAINVAQLRETFLELSAVGEPSGEGLVPTAVPEVLFSALERGYVTEILVEVPKVAREIAEVIDAEVDEATASFWADVADEAWVGFAVRVVDVTSYPDLSGDSWRVIATSEDVCEVLAGVEFAELYPDEVPLWRNLGISLVLRQNIAEKLEKGVCNMVDTFILVAVGFCDIPRHLADARLTKR